MGQWRRREGGDQCTRRRARRTRRGREERKARRGLRWLCSCFFFLIFRGGRRPAHSHFHTQIPCSLFPLPPPASLHEERKVSACICVWSGCAAGRSLHGTNDKFGAGLWHTHCDHAINTPTTYLHAMLRYPWSIHSCELHVYANRIPSFLVF